MVGKASGSRALDLREVRPLLASGVLQTVVAGITAVVEKKYEECKQGASSQLWSDFLDIVTPMTVTFPEMSANVEVAQKSLENAKKADRKEALERCCKSLLHEFSSKEMQTLTSVWGEFEKNDVGNDEDALATLSSMLDSLLEECLVPIVQLFASEDTTKLVVEEAGTWLATLKAVAQVTEFDFLDTDTPNKTLTQTRTKRKTFFLESSLQNASRT